MLADQRNPELDECVAPITNAGALPEVLRWLIDGGPITIVAAGGPAEPAVKVDTDGPAIGQCFAGHRASPVVQRYHAGWLLTAPMSGWTQEERRW